jgi:hypothetical protein
LPLRMIQQVHRALQQHHCCCSFAPSPWPIFCTAGGWSPQLAGPVLAIASAAAGRDADPTAAAAGGAGPR